MTLERQQIDQRKSRSRNRLRGTFMDQLPRQLEGLAALTQGPSDPEARRSVSGEMLRLAKTARALGLDRLGAALITASEEIVEAVNAHPAEFIFNVVRDMGIRQRFSPIGLVATGPLRELLERQIVYICEPLVLVDSIDDLAEHPGRDGFQAEVVPARQLTAPVPAGRMVFVYGENHDIALRRKVMELGATGFIPNPLRLGNALRLVRRHAYQKERKKPRIVFLGDQEETGHALRSVCEKAGIISFVATDEYLFEILEDARPDLLIIWAESVTAVQEVMHLVSTSEGTWNLPILVVGEEADRQQYEASGARLVLDRAEAPEEQLKAILHRMALTQRVRDTRDLWTGLLDRSEILYELDRELARVRRSEQIVTVAIIEVLGVAQMNALAGHLVGETAFRSIAAFLQRSLREFDLVGHLGGDTLLVVLPGCTSKQGADRLKRVLERIAALQTEIAEMAGLATVLGTADTTTGLTEVLMVADANLCASRSVMGRY